MTLKQGATDSELSAYDDSFANPDDLLPPLDRLEKYANSDRVFNRLYVVRNALETLRLIHEDKDAVDRLVNVLSIISEDFEGSVRLELMVELPHIAAFCKDVKLNYVVVQHLVPVLINYLGDENSLARKMAHSALLTIIEDGLLDYCIISEKVCPLIIHLTENTHPEELRTESINLLSKLVVLVGKKAAEDFFFERLFDLCADSSSNIRKACASTFGDLCTTCGRHTTEVVLLPKFLVMCEDSAWCVRKACAENFTPVSRVVSKEIRWRELSDLYMLLLCDQNRWVRLTAYQALGPFISTFADPERTGLHYTKDGGLVVNEGIEIPVVSNGVMCNGDIMDWPSPKCPEVPPDVSRNPGISCENTNCSVINSTSTTDLVEGGGLSSDSDCDSASFSNSTQKSDENGVCWHQITNDGAKELGRLLNEVFFSIPVNGGAEARQEPNKSDSSCETPKNPEDCDLLPTEASCDSSTEEPQSDCTLLSNGDDLAVCSCPSPCDGDDASSKSHNCSQSQDSCVQKKPLLNGEVDDGAFNQFQYWRDPLLEIDFEATMEDLNKPPDQRSIWACRVTREMHNGFGEEVSCKKFMFNWSRTSSASHENISENQKNSVVEKSEETKRLTVSDQDIVPPELLRQYVSMVDVVWAQTIDAEIARHCAYSFPAVALTLGRQFWPCLLDTFQALSSDKQGFIMMWKVRRTVASAMHQLAVILGPEITSRDLLPVFSRFINDMDEVRIGILEHLFEFLEVLKPEERKRYLPSLIEFLVSNTYLPADWNEKNWRFRLIFAEQLVLIVELYEPLEVKAHLVPLALELLQNKVCEVRLAAVRVIAAILLRFRQCEAWSIRKSFLTQLFDEFLHSPKWLYRQLFVYISQECITEGTLSPDQYAEDFFPDILYLCWDRVPNVRIAIARCLVTTIWPLVKCSSDQSPHHELLLQTIHTLQSDVDADVRFFANTVATNECACLQNGEFTHLVEPFV